MDCVSLTRDPILMEEMLRQFPASPECGARVWFEGVVRADHPALRAIDYTAYEMMAKKELAAMAQEAKTKWPLCTVVIVHRIGAVAVGETSLLVLVQAPHRKEALAGLQYIIDELKKRAPIWKKEFYEEESSRHLGRREELPVWQG